MYLMKLNFEYYSSSPFVYCGNNPINRIDPTGMEWEDVENYFKNLLAQVNATLPSTHRITKLTVRKEDFKRTGTLKVSRN